MILIVNSARSQELPGHRAELGPSPESGTEHGQGMFEDRFILAPRGAFPGNRDHHRCGKTVTAAMTYRALLCAKAVLWSLQVSHLILTTTFLWWKLLK